MGHVEYQIVPLAYGRADSPSNVRRQAKAKGDWVLRGRERAGGVHTAVA